MSENNMRIWDQVCKTDPSHTKKVSFGRKFTAIDAQHQIMNATRLWGPIGEGWGLDARHDSITCGTVTVAISDVVLWWREDDKRHSTGPVRASNVLMSNKGQVDEDAWKKATTDALTKLLSYHGFNADVFLGQFDDNRYVQERTQAVQKEAMSESQSKMEELKAKLPTLTTKPHALNWAKKHKEEIDSLDPKHRMQFKVAFQGHLDELLGEYYKKERSKVSGSNGLKHIGDIMPSNEDEQTQPQDYMNV